MLAAMKVLSVLEQSGPGPNRTGSGTEALRENSPLEVRASPAPVALPGISDVTCFLAHSLESPGDRCECRIAAAVMGHMQRRVHSSPGTCWAPGDIAVTEKRRTAHSCGAYILVGGNKIKSCVICLKTGRTRGKREGEEVVGDTGLWVLHFRPGGQGWSCSEGSS